MHDGVAGFSFFAVLVTLLLIVVLVLAVTATVWLIRDMPHRRAGREGGQSPDQPPTG